MQEQHDGVQAHGLGKRFGDLWAVRDVDLDVPPGTVLGLLGHNGAGKTTTIRMLTTLSAPTEGTARVAGFDPARNGAQVRARIGLAGQQATVDGLLTARANFVMVGRLSGLGRAEARERAAELLERFDLVDAGDRLAKEYSGGMRRRLDLAASMVASPPVLFLDEPTTGLDPRARNELWLLIREMVGAGTTLVLTTQYLEEADRIADSIVVLDDGRIAASGSPAALKAELGGERVEVTAANATDLRSVPAALEAFATSAPSIDIESGLAVVPVLAGTPLVDVVRTLDEAGVEITDVRRREATLDDVFLTLTDSTPADAAGDETEGLMEVAA